VGLYLAPSAEEGRNDRRPHSNMKNRGRPKKGGGGGKGTWGKPGMDDLYEADVAFDEGMTSIRVVLRGWFLRAHGLYLLFWLAIR